jgi:hypothetical protein
MRVMVYGGVLLEILGLFLETPPGRCHCCCHFRVELLLVSTAQGVGCVLGEGRGLGRADRRVRALTRKRQVLKWLDAILVLCLRIVVPLHRHCRVP